MTFQDPPKREQKKGLVAWTHSLPTLRTVSSTWAWFLLGELSFETRRLEGDLGVH
jgi:hypothetical protein